MDDAKDYSTPQNSFEFGLAVLNKRPSCRFPRLGTHISLIINEHEIRFGVRQGASYISASPNHNNVIVWVL